ncbi:hypothetical protein [Haliangium sp.]|uniref:hypothetical protein n=1 Tax=Haliangium sp. TaxID=2663208 RepID=UPI003D0D5F64
MPKNLVLRPNDGHFDLPAVRSWLDSRPDALLDPVGTDAYMLCGLPNSIWARREARLGDPSRFPRGGLLFLQPEQILLRQESADAEELRSGMEFMRWMWGQFSLTVREDGGQDFTELCRREGVEVLYPERLRDAPLPWAGRLIRVGFYRELDHGDGDDPSLEALQAEQAAPDEDRMLAYLDAGHLYIASPGIVEDVLADRETWIGPAHLLTDGTYVWPADLVYYLRTYHVRLPTSFWVHARRNDFQIPADVDVASLQL